MGMTIGDDATMTRRIALHRRHDAAAAAAGGTDRQSTAPYYTAHDRTHTLPPAHVHTPTSA